ncbi:alpha/beta hydrolase fold protein [Desulfovibrio sp. X2]|uniref:alpha/beta fold hydrolase n=1 Tax=Desulfovibrio sp. X2 TaxID=941449 RepID=UPI000358C99D|nr:alpha/beta hydrolase [Desulfovibrio sp. X2]EPR44308.1 alpha/beta hydrolase fold protein [Desulfovibrio sp. X2]
MPFLERDGLRLHYEDSGPPAAGPDAAVSPAGGLPLLFIHGNSCDGTFFAPLTERFAPARRCIVPDLRGHGQSDAPEDAAYTYHAFTDDLAALCRSLRVPRVVAVGHSMGGAVAVRLAASRPDLVAGLAALDSTLLPPPGLELWLDPLLRKLAAAPDASPMRDFYEPLFGPEDDPVRRQEIVARLECTPRHVVLALMDLFRDPDYESALRSARCPLLYVSANRHRTDWTALRRLAPQTRFAQAALSGHFLPLEVPEQIGPMLGRFLANLGTVPAPGA